MVWNDNMAVFLSFFIDSNRNNFCRRERCCDQFFWGFAPFDNVDFFAAQFFYDSRNTGTFWTDASAYCVNVFVFAPYCDFGSGTSFTGNCFDFNSTVFDFWSVHFEEAFDQTWMGTGDHQFWTSAVCHNISNVNHDALTFYQLFVWNLFGFWQDHFCFVDFQSDVAVIWVDSHNWSRHDLEFTVFVFFQGLFFFSFADTLTDHVFCRLSCNTAKFFGFQRNFYFCTNLNIFAVFECFDVRNFGFWIYNFFYNVFADCNVETFFHRIDLNDVVFGTAHVAFYCNCNRGADFFDEVLYRDAFVSSQQVESFKELIVHFHFVSYFPSVSFRLIVWTYQFLHKDG